MSTDNQLQIDAESYVASVEIDDDLIPSARSRSYIRKLLMIAYVRGKSDGLDVAMEAFDRHAAKEGR